MKTELILIAVFLFIVLFILAMYFGFYGLIAYVIFHFIHKFW